MIRITANTQAATAAVMRIKAALQGGGAARVLDSVAYKTLGQLVQSTPKRWTGQVRKGWQIGKDGGAFYVTNVNKVMLFLEKGTKSHGPVSARALFIPLNRKAMLGGGGLVFGKDFILAKRVKGIQAMRIVQKQRVRTRTMLINEMRNYIRKVLS